MPRESKPGWRVVPANEFCYLVSSEKFIQQFLLQLAVFCVAQSLRKVWSSYKQVERRSEYLYARSFRVIDGLFPVKDAVVVRAPAEKVLRSLVNETPPQV